MAQRPMSELEQQRERIHDDLRGLIAGDVRFDDVFVLRDPTRDVAKLKLPFLMAPEISHQAVSFVALSRATRSILNL